MVHVYYACIAPLLEKAVFEEKLKLVTKQRRDKILRCKNNTDQCRALASGLLFRYGCIREGWNCEAVAEGEYGKPLMQEDNCYFNLTHAGDYAAAVFSDRLVGIDVEDCRRFKTAGQSKEMEDQTGHRAVQGMALERTECEEEQRVRRLARKVLSTQEQDIFYQLPREKQARELIRIWTRKEAYAKAVGKGMAMNFSGIDTEREEWFYTLALEPDYWMSVCLPEEGIGNLREKITLEEIDLRFLFT